jgi:hypothetical protein
LAIVGQSIQAYQVRRPIVAVTPLNRGPSFSSPTCHFSIIVGVSLFVSAIIVGSVHPTTKVCDIFFGIVPLVLDVLRNVFDFLHLSTSPTCSILREVFDVVDSVVKSILHTIIEVLDTAYLLTGPTSSIFWEVRNVVAVLVKAIFDTVLVALKIVL